MVKSVLFSLFTSFPLTILGALKVSFDLRNIRFCQFCETKITTTLTLMLILRKNNNNINFTYWYMYHFSPNSGLVIFANTGIVTLVGEKLYCLICNILHLKYHCQNAKLQYLVFLIRIFPVFIFQKNTFCNLN